jgi:GWxTD domain-containing protein
VALAAHRAAAGTPAAGMPAVLLARGRVERIVGSPDSALAAFRAYGAAGGLESLALLEEARTRFVLGDLQGQESYYRGARFDDSLVVGLYREDLAPIATSAELEEFDAARGPAREAYLRAFWRERDQYDLRVEGERLREHYQRLHQARKRYRIATARRRYDLDERYRSGSREFDDRGIILIRHGEPDDSATFMWPDACANISWRYDRPEGHMLFHFVARSDVSDFHLVESLMDVAGAGGMYSYQNLECERPPRSDLALSREHLDPLYLRIATASVNTYTMLQQEERKHGQRDIAIGTTTDRYPLRYGDSLDVRAEGATVGFAPDGRPLLQVAYALRGATAEPVASNDGLMYSVRIRLAARDRAGRMVAYMDSTRAYRASARVTDDGFLIGRVAIPVDTGLVEWRLAVDQGGERGFVFPVQRTSAVAPGGPFALSDIALGAPGLSAEWPGEVGEVVRLNPLGAWRSGGDLDLYAEVYGTESGAPLAVELTLSRLGGGKFLGIFGGKKQSLTVTSTEPSRGAVSPIRKTVTLTDLKPGEYRLRLHIRDGAGRSTIRERVILVRPRTGPGMGR